MNILLVDDEPVCISTVSHILENMYEKKVTIFSAVSSKEALKIVKEERIDLVFTDIRMPDMDGLELAKSIIKISPLCEIVILSAYDQKKYLKTAINLNVLRYLQKPVDPAEIIEVTNIVSEKHSALKNISVQGKLDLLQGKIAEILISKNYQPQKIKILAEHIYDLDFFSCRYYAVCIILTDSSPVGFEISEAIQKLAYEKNILTIKTTKNEAILYIFGGNDKGLSNTVSSELENTLLPYTEKMQICIGNTVSKVEDISRSYVNAYILTEYSFYTKKGIHKYDKSKNYSDYRKLPDPTIFNIESIPDYEYGFNTFLESTYLSLKKTASTPKKSVHMLFFNIINHMLIQAMNNGIFCDVSVNDIHYMNFLTIDDLYEFTHNFVAEHSLCIPINKIAFNIKNYIKQNYKNKNLSVDMIASQFNMSPQYIPKLFKKSFNISIMQYVTDTRISAAKSLIRTQDMGIKNIAEAVGYDDANYFSRLFKKKTGMTYTEYKKQ
ncbi:MAG: response regulator [Firmicutes bacterium]|nr:response regulator [Bacillota bacterium]